MALASVMPPQPKEKGASALENASKILGIGASLAGLGAQAYGTLNPTQSIGAPPSEGAPLNVPPSSGPQFEFDQPLVFDPRLKKPTPGGI